MVEPVSPELALVCPELRRRALTALPDLDPDALFRPARPAPQAVARAREVPLVLAAGAYTAVCIAQWLVWASVTFAGAVVVTLLLTLAGS